MRISCPLLIILVSLAALRCSSTPIIKTVDSKKSISEVNFITLNGVRQYISIRGEDTENPILLFLHGGPGTAVMPLSRIYNREVEKHFVVVNWDQRGSGRSKIAKNGYKLLTIDTFVEDARSLTLFLCERFNKKKIYLIGHSWGSLIGINFAYKYPEVIEKYISIGQIVNTERSEQIAWQYLLKNVSDKTDMARLNEIGAPVSGYYRGGYSDFYAQRAMLLKYGGVLYGQNTFSTYIKQCIISEEYTPLVMSDWLYGSRNSLETLWPEIAAKADLFRQIPSLKVPVVFIAGRHDYNTYYGLIEEYYQFIEAEKSIVWFENSAHAPIYEESEKFNRVIINEKGGNGY